MHPLTFHFGFGDDSLHLFGGGGTGATPNGLNLSRNYTIKGSRCWIPLTQCLLGILNFIQVSFIPQDIRKAADCRSSSFVAVDMVNGPELCLTTTTRFLAYDSGGGPAGAPPLKKMTQMREEGQPIGPSAWTAAAGTRPCWLPWDMAMSLRE
ncbi:hypothetical protein AVEN_173876-1 [Araneus ventricosus]|uniref:Uncharacterized protein n=1 Tax=Araneus ventricosus TaxID=182803 RepID=A0A4Y2I019_ARAVE|nr:hypothetical protein AVEN_173876-1 [Araneus ventricosus]